MSPEKSPLQTPGCPFSRGDRGSWPSRPSGGSEGWRLPGRFLPHAHESVSLQLSLGSERSSFATDFPRLSASLGGDTGPGQAGGSVLLPVVHLAT